MLRLVKEFYNFLLFFGLIFAVLAKLLVDKELTDEELEEIKNKYYEMRK